MDKKDLDKVLEALVQAYAKAGRTLETVTVHYNGEEELVIDNRDQQQIH